jgi:hypothetical protein
VGGASGRFGVREEILILHNDIVRIFENNDEVQKSETG